MSKTLFVPVLCLPFALGVFASGCEETNAVTPAVDASADAAPDYLLDRNNCGRAGNVCPEGIGCQRGICCSTLACATPGEALVCVGYDDVAHCGGCNLACKPTESCIAATCRCADDEQACNGACVAKNDPAHCGGCNSACEAGDVCAGAGSGNVCAKTCAPYEATCTRDGATRCVAYDRNNCGGCGVVCSGKTPMCDVSEGRCVEGEVPR